MEQARTRAGLQARAREFASRRPARAARLIAHVAERAPRLRMHTGMSRTVSVRSRFRPGPSIRAARPARRGSAAALPAAHDCALASASSRPTASPVAITARSRAGASHSSTPREQRALCQGRAPPPPRACHHPFLAELPARRHQAHRRPPVSAPAPAPTIGKCRAHSQGTAPTCSTTTQRYAYRSITTTRSVQRSRRGAPASRSAIAAPPAHPKHLAACIGSDRRIMPSRIGHQQDHGDSGSTR